MICPGVSIVTLVRNNNNINNNNNNPQTLCLLFNDLKEKSKFPF